MAVAAAQREPRIQGVALLSDAVVVIDQPAAAAGHHPQALYGSADRDGAPNGQVQGNELHGEGGDGQDDRRQVEPIHPSNGKKAQQDEQRRRPQIAV